MSDANWKRSPREPKTVRLFFASAIYSPAVGALVPRTYNGGRNKAKRARRAAAKR